ncbi:MAG: hypothetical protein HFH36_13660 [Lachnospiraceae bacterium]|nr:hypothetical protein [Lachnospiraceae bacterium]
MGSRHCYRKQYYISVAWRNAGRFFGRHAFGQLQKKMKKYGLINDNVKFLTYSALGKLDDEKHTYKTRRKNLKKVFGFSSLCIFHRE